MTNNKKLYSISETIKIIGLGRTALYKEIKNGNLAVKKYGSRTLITAEAIDNFINSLPSHTKEEA